MADYKYESKKKPTDVEKLTTTFVQNGKIESTREIIKFLKGFKDTDILKDMVCLRFEVADITAIDPEILEALRPGDMVIKITDTHKHSYRVSYKGATGLCLTYSDCENVETVAYEKTGDVWAYDSTDITHIGA